MKKIQLIIFIVVMCALIPMTHAFNYKNNFLMGEKSYAPNLRVELFSVWSSAERFDLDCDSLVAPTSSSQTFCSEAHISDLVATGETGAVMKWYDTAVGGTALSGTTVLTAGTYYVSQELENCESSRISVVISFVEADFTNFNIGNYSHNSVLFSRATAPAPNYEIFYSTSMDNAPSATTAALVSNLSTATTTITGLTPNTNYFYWGRSSCSATDKGSWIFITQHSTVASFPYHETFQGEQTWNFMNHTRNKWFQGIAARGLANKSLYISNDVNGATYNYNVTGANVSHAYKDFYLEEDVTNLAMSFDWRCFGDGFGATKADYFRVWLVNFDYIPIAGTAITASPTRVLLDNNTFNNNNQFLRYRTVFNAAALQLSSTAGDASHIVRVIFEWRNDAADGNQPPAAIDNITIEETDCLPPANFRRGALTQNSIQVSWDAVAGVTEYDVYYSDTAGFIIPDNQAESLTVTNATTTTLTGLTADTNYKIWVRSKCSSTSKSIWVGPIATRTAQIPAPLPLVEGFEGTINWSFDNDVTNKWVVGTAVRTRGTKSLYISNNLGVTNAYTLNTPQVSHVYRDVTIPGFTDNLSLSFDWKNFGEGFVPAAFLDYFRIWMVPTSFVPVPGQEITAVSSGGFQVGVNGYNNEESFVRGNAIINLGLLSPTSTTRRLIFEWINNRQLGNQTPAAIDNVELKVFSCAAPSDLVYDAIAENTATVSWTAPAPAPAGYELFYDQVGSLPMGSTVPTMTGITGTTTTLSGLTSNTVYYLWMRSVCTSGSSYWVGPYKFITSQVPAILPYEDDFEGVNNWTTLFSDKVNKWFVGTAIAHGVTGKSLYISNDSAGAVHQYTLNRNQVSFAYRDLAVPAGTHQLLINFDWVARGEGTVAIGRDYMRVWMVPTTYIPVEGVATTVANSGGIQLGVAHYLGINGFVHEQIEANINAFAGTTGRLLFEWVNNNSGGAQPPAAVDNVKIEVITCPKVRDLGVCAGEGSAEFFWTPAGGEVEWEVAIETGLSALDSPDPATPIISVEDFPEYIDTSLTAGLNYTVFVRAVCGTNDKSLWVKHTFRNFSFDVSSANPFCAGNEALIFPNAFGDRTLNNKFGSVGCLGSTPNAVWYFLKIGETGNLNFQIVQNTNITFTGTGLDVDFIAFGPFDNMRQACSQIDLNNPGRNSIACSYSAAPVENFSIPNAVRGQIYVLLITNYNGAQGFIKLEQTGGSGTTDCSFACTVDLGPDLVICGTQEQVLNSRLVMAGEEGNDEPIFSWYQNDDLMDPLIYNTPTITVTESGTYRVVVEKDFCSENPTDEIEVLFVEDYTGRAPEGKIVCDEDPDSEVPLENDGLYEFNLLEYGTGYISTDADPSSLTFSFHESLDDAERDRNPIVLGNSYVSGTRTIYFRVVRHDAKKCAWIYRYELVVQPTLYLKADFDIQRVICLTNDDFIEPILEEGTTEGGEFLYSTGDEFDMRKLIINRSTGVIDVKNSEVGKYSVIYRVPLPDNHCGYTVDKSIEIEIIDKFQIIETGDCVKGEYKLKIINLLGKERHFDSAKYEWTGPGGFSAEGIEIIVPEAGTYNVLVTTEQGCFEELEIYLENVDCMIQKGISPNFDGVNDFFDLSRYKVMKLSIYNRYGTKVYDYGAGYTKEWFGQSKSNSILPDGTYFYELLTETELITGWIQINK